MEKYDNITEYLESLYPDGIKISEYHKVVDIIDNLRENNKIKNGEIEITRCLYCGERIINKHGNAKYCSPKCRKNAWYHKNAK